MEFIFSVPLLLCFIFLTYLSLHVFLKEKKPLLAAENHSNNKKTPLLPPGRTGLPLIGESLDYFSKVKNNVIEEFVTKRMNKYSEKVFKTSLLGQPMAILCGAEGNKFLFSNEKKLVQVWFSSSFDKIFPKTENTTNTQDYKRVRKMLPSFLKVDTLGKYVGTMDMVMKQHLHTHWKNRHEVVVAPTISKFTLTLACRFFLSIEDPKKVEELTKPIVEVEAGLLSMPINLPGTALNRAIKASKYMRNEVAAIVRQRKIDLSDKSASATQDILSYMLLTTDESGEFFSESNIVSNLFGLIEGGYATMSSALTFIMKYLAELPHVYDEVLREQMEITNSKENDEMLAWHDLRKMRYSWNVAQEVLRLMPPGLGAFREAITDFNYAGYIIPKGWKLHWIANATHKNPDYFSDPEKFDPSRFDGSGPTPYTFVPFGGGPRMCPGNEYARLAILVFMHNIVTNFRWEKLLPTEAVKSNPIPTPAKGFPVKLHPHKHKIGV